MTDDIKKKMAERMAMVTVPRSAVVNGLSELISQSMSNAAATYPENHEHRAKFYARRAERLCELREDFECLMSERA